MKNFNATIMNKKVIAVSLAAAMTLSGAALFGCVPDAHMDQRPGPTEQEIAWDNAKQSVNVKVRATGEGIEKLGTLKLKVVGTDDEGEKVKKEYDVNPAEGFTVKDLKPGAYLFAFPEKLDPINDQTSWLLPQPQQFKVTDKDLELSFEFKAVPTKEADLANGKLSTDYVTWRGIILGMKTGDSEVGASMPTITPTVVEGTTNGIANNANAAGNGTVNGAANGGNTGSGNANDAAASTGNTGNNGSAGSGNATNDAAGNGSNAGGGNTGGGGATNTPSTPAPAPSTPEPPAPVWVPNNVWVEDSAAWDEPIYELHCVCHTCGAFIEGFAVQHLEDTDHTGYGTKMVQTGTVHHEATGHYEDRGYWQ